MLSGEEGRTVASSSSQGPSGPSAGPGGRNGLALKVEAPGNAADAPTASPGPASAKPVPQSPIEKMIQRAESAKRRVRERSLANGGGSPVQTPPSPVKVVAWPSPRRHARAAGRGTRPPSACHASADSARRIGRYLVPQTRSNRHSRTRSPTRPLRHTRLRPRVQPPPPSRLASRRRRETHRLRDKRRR